MNVHEQTGWEHIDEPCPNCGVSGEYYYKTYEDDEGHEDEMWKCFSCGDIHWVEGADS